MWAYDWYYRAFVWPVQIQRETLGRQIAARDDLTGQSASQAYGQGLFRWTYHLEEDAAWADLCQPRGPNQSCTFSRVRAIDGGKVRLIATYENKTLILEEVWL